jgi:PIN domain
MRPTLYVETSIISYLAARPSRDLITAAHQQTTHTWWRERRQDFDIYASQVVLNEAAGGDPEVANRRMELLKDVPLLDLTPEVADLAAALTERLLLPKRAGADATHIALAGYHNVNFLLTRNCTHIANAELRPRIESVCREKGHSVPILCTPDELMGESSNER